MWISKNEHETTFSFRDIESKEDTIWCSFLDILLLSSFLTTLLIHFLCILIQTNRALGNEHNNAGFCSLLSHGKLKFWFVSSPKPIFLSKDLIPHSIVGSSKCLIESILTYSFPKLSSISFDFWAVLVI